MRLLLILIAAAAHATASATLAVVLGHNGGADALHLLVLLLDLLGIRLRVRVQPGLAILEGVHDLLLLLLVHLLAQALVLARPLSRRPHGVNVAVEGILGIDALLHLLILISELLRLLDHLLDLLLRQAALVVGDGDLLTLARGLVFCSHVQDAVGVDLKGDLNLRLATRRRGDPAQLELAEEVVVLGHGTLALEDLDVHGWLVVLVSREDLRLLRGDHGVPVDELRHHASNGLDTERERSHVEQEQVLPALPAQDACLHGGSIRHGLVRVDATVRLLAVEEVLDELLHLRDPGGATHKHDLVDLSLLQAGVLHNLLHRAQGVLEEVVVDLLEARPGQGLREVDAIEERLDLHAPLVGRAQSTLRLLHLAPELLDRTLVLGHVLAMLLLEDLHEVLHDPLIEVLSAKVGVAVRGHDLKDAIVDREERHVEGAASEVVHQDVLLRLLVEAVRDGGRRWLVDDTQDIETGDHASILRGLPLLVVEVRRHGDHGMLDLLAQVILSGLFHLSQDHGRHLLRGHNLVFALHLDADVRLPTLVDNLEGQQLDVLLHGRVLEAAPDEPLNVEKRLRRIHRRLVLGRLADEALVVGEGDVRGRDAVALIVRDDLHAAILVDAHARVRRAQIDADDRAIDLLLVVLARGQCGKSEQQGQAPRHRGRNPQG
mmetsp:Transcript_65145/g.169278  ORF Transcript_65145/g.169278 Transcript_65145/m.169278 type:complete len:661 (-) Transcript_65145:54-2036(-)